MTPPAAPRVFLNPGREKSVLLRHPWVFAGGVAQVEGDPLPGATVLVCSYARQPQIGEHTLNSSH